MGIATASAVTDFMVPSIEIMASINPRKVAVSPIKIFAGLKL